MLDFFFTQTPLIFFIQSFWRDEAFSYFLAKKNLIDILILTAKDFNPPLYYLILHFWIKIFGSSEIALRSLSLIFFWATVYVVFLFLNKILKIRSFSFTIYYLLLTIFNPLLLYYAFEARMYTMFAFFSALSFYAFYQKNSNLYLISSIFGLYTHYFMIFVIFGQMVYLFIFTKRKNHFLISQFLNFFIIFIFFLPWIAFVLSQKNTLLPSFWIEKMTVFSFFSLPAVIYTGYEAVFKFFNHSILKLSVFLIFLIIIGFFRIYKKNQNQKKLFFYLFIWAIVTPVIIGLISFIKPIFLPRYLIFSIVGFLLLLIFILEQLPKILKLILYLLLIIISLNFNQQTIKYRQKSDLRKIIRKVKFLANQNDLMYVTTELDYFPAQYYFDENRVYVYKKSYEEIPDYVGKVLIPKSRFVDTLPVYPKKAFILTSDSHYEIQSISPQLPSLDSNED